MMGVFLDSRHKLKLGELQEELRNMLSQETENYEVRLSNGNYLNNEWGSHRGDYYDMYISDFGSGRITLTKLINLIDEAMEIGIMTGYKGGNFIVDRSINVGFTVYGCGGGTWPFAVVKYKNEIIIIVD